MNRKPMAWLTLVLLLAPVFLAAQWAGTPKTTIRVGEISVVVELARTPDEKSRGLMYRDTLAEDEGMLFVNEKPGTLSFWMKNTRVPLSIAYIDEKRAIRQIEDMQPFSEDAIVSTVPCQYALEMNQGWFAKHGIEPGAVVDLSQPEREGLLTPTP